ncbi:hypothetical protein IHE55_16235 [Streptomyces pactum]|nr:DUF6227 family protein [Streptomyces pactum]MBH5336246.1 hypothetical protein [Streptomyces pactum]
MVHEQSGGTPAEHLDGLLARAQNGFEIDDTVIIRLRDALMHQTELRSCRQCNEPPAPRGYTTFRHIFLLPDGSSVVLWELQHSAGPGDGLQHELYADEEALLRAERRAHLRTGGTSWAEVTLEGLRPEEVLRTPLPVETVRAYVADNSADHARRVLRRAENEDRPGKDVERLLETAFAHDIALAPKPRRRSGGEDTTWCRFYEHAFLLAGGDEITLWELEHNLTSDGRLVCEVYLDEGAAEMAADRRARARGVEL